jgi:O-antigen biosynthesis protein
MSEHGTEPSSVTIVIPTYNRPGPLVDCIRSIVQGRQLPAEIVVVGRDGDARTAEVMVKAQGICTGKTILRVGWVTQPGHLPPVQKGLVLAANKIVAFLDDDVTVTPDWLAHLVVGFQDSKVGVVGGRVITPVAPALRLKGKPGNTSWYGRHWGNVASLQGESAIDVQGVMECNWAWRRSVLNSISFDPILNFDDACMYGLDLCLQARSAGWRIVYEPHALVYHHAAPRAIELDRTDRPRRTFAYSRNYTYIMLKHLEWWRKPIFLAWWFLIGERASWGLAAVFADAARGRPPRPKNVWSSLSGKFRGIFLRPSPERSNG